MHDTKLVKHALNIVTIEFLQCDHRERKQIKLKLKYTVV